MWWLLWTLGARNLLGCGWWKARLRRLVAARAGKSHWLATVLGRWEARSATEATMEPPDTKSRNQGGSLKKISPDGNSAHLGPFPAESRRFHPFRRRLRSAQAACFDFWTRPMPSISFIPCANAQQLCDAIAPWLADDPVPCALACGIANRFATPVDWAGVLSADGVPIVALVQTPPHPVIIAAPGTVDPACVDAMAALLRNRADTVPGINGPGPWAEAVAQAVGAQISDRMGLRLHRLVGTPRVPRHVAGELRPFAPDETGILIDWDQAFSREIEPGQPPPQRDQATLDRFLADSIAWAVDGRPVSIARRVRPLLGGWTIAAVYTPPELRGRGYAGAAVHGLCAKLLAEGASYVALFTDLANPTSNRLYGRIGFVPCLDQVRILWNFP
jgi:GNAT superfamily N-acetyltransferase